MAVVDDPRLQAARFSSAIVGTAVVWLTVLAFARANPVDLTVALLVVLAEVLAVAVLSGPVLAVLVALAAGVLVNWYLVPPFGTFAIDSADNVVALVVFTLVAVVAATLVELGARARSRARESTRQAELLGDIVVPSEGENAAKALERVREGLHLDQVELIGHSGGEPSRALASTGPASATPVVLDVALPDGYRMIGRGAEMFAPDPDFLTSLGSAAVRAFESQRLHEESLRADELEAIDRARTALLASVGHDLRTPLAGLRVSIETLRALDSSLDQVDRVALMETIELSAERLDELITNLLDMSRLQAGALIAHPEPTDVSDVIDRVVIALPDDRLEVHVGADLPSVKADPALLERMVANLVSNALRYSPPGSAVVIVAHREAASVQVNVIDRGPGIPDQHAAEVFEPFHRVGAQPDGGTGLGLAIVKGFGDAMGISVRLTTGPNGGLTASLDMPQWMAAEPIR
ncbi:MAG: ATP-binding protein [Actinomycetes bacterium]